MILWWSTLCVAAPLLAAVLLFIRPKWMAGIALIAVTLVLVGALGLASVLHDSGPQFIAIGGWGAPLGIGWRIDGLAVTMLLMAGIVGWPVTLYAQGYFGGAAASRHGPEQPSAATMRPPAGCPPLASAGRPGGYQTPGTRGESPSTVR